MEIGLGGGLDTHFNHIEVVVDDDDDDDNNNNDDDVVMMMTNIEERMTMAMRMTNLIIIRIL